MRNATRKASPTVLTNFHRPTEFPSVLYQCGLLLDLKLFEAGDETEVGEKGLTLRYACFFSWPIECLSWIIVTVAEVRRCGILLVA